MCVDASVAAAQAFLWWCTLHPVCTIIRNKHCRLAFVDRHLACQRVQTDVDDKIKWATQATEKAQAAQTQLESDISKLQSDLKNEVTAHHMMYNIICASVLLYKFMLVLAANTCLPTERVHDNCDQTQRL